MCLQSQGWATIPVVYPTVPRGEERIRFSVHAGNTKEEIHEFLQAIVSFIREGNWDIPPSGIVFDGGDRMTFASKL